MSKQLKSSIFIAIATIMILVMTILPHHHHGERICYVMEQCEHDFELNDKHTNHNAESENHESENSCVVHTNYLLNKNIQLNITKAELRPDHKLRFSLLRLSAACLNTDNFSLYVNLISWNYKKTSYFCFYNSLKTKQIHGLRAPPLT